MRIAAVGLVVAWASVAHAEGDVLIQLDGPNNIVLQRQLDVEDSWKTECNGPCDRVVPEGTYRIRGHDVRESAPFELQEQGAERLHVVAHVASKDARSGALTLLGFGAAGVTVATALLIGGSFAAASDLCFLRSNPCPDNHSAPLLVGAVLAGVGAAMLAVGIALTLHFDTTSVSLTPTELRVSF